MLVKPHDEANVMPGKRTNSAVPNCKRKATVTIASSRAEDFAYVPVCRPHNDEYLENLTGDDDTMQNVVSTF